MTWTPWKKVADRLDWYTEHSLRLPVCYQLAWLDGRAQGEDRAIQVVYAGAAASEARRLAAYARGDTPLAGRIQAGIDAGRELFYRARGAPTLEAAQALLAELLAEGAPPWNEDA